MYTTFTMDSYKDAKRLSEAASKHADPIYVHSENDLTIVDARSLLGLLSLLRQPCHIATRDGADPIAFAKFVNKVK